MAASRIKGITIERLANLYDPSDGFTIYIPDDDKEKEKRALAGEIHFLVDSKYTDIMRKAGIDKELKRESFKGFIRTWEKRAGLIEELDVVLWSRLVQEVIVKAKDDIRLSSRMDLK